MGNICVNLLHPYFASGSMAVEILTSILFLPLLTVLLSRAALLMRYW